MDSDSGAQDSVVLASYQDRRGAEHMLAKLGRGFRKQARRGTADAFVISRNRDGSVKVTEARVVSASAFVAALIRFVLAIGIGFMGILSSIRGVKRSDTRVISEKVTLRQMIELRPCSRSVARKEPLPWCSARIMRHDSW